MDDAGIMPSVYKGVIRPKHYLRFCQFLGNSSKTIRAYMNSLKSFKAFLDKDVYQATDKDIFDYHSFLETETRNFNLAASSTRLRWYALNKFYRLALAENWVRYNPFVEVDKISPDLKLTSAVNESSLPKIDGEELNGDLINQAIDLSNDKRLGAMIRVLSRTGARVSELLTLKWDQLAVSGNDAVYTFFGKGRKIRNVTDWGGRQLVEEMKTIFVSEDLGDSDYVFINEKGRVFTYSSIYLRIRRLFDKFNPDHPISPHKFRHFFITYLLNVEKMSLKSVQLIAGHSSPVTTIRYDHPPEIKYNVGV